MNKKIILIFIFAFLIRLIALNQSLWLDEAVTSNVVKNFNFLQIINKFSPTDFHPPLYYLFMKLWTNFFGYSEIVLRMPSVLFSLATGYVVYLIGGAWAAVFFLFNPLIVYYSQEARMYMMVTLLITLALYFFISNIKNKISKIHIKNQIYFNLFIFLTSSFIPSISIFAKIGISGISISLKTFSVLVSISRFLKTGANFEMARALGKPTPNSLKLNFSKL